MTRGRIAIGEFVFNRDPACGEAHNFPMTVSRLPGLVLTDHEFRVPLDYDRPERGEISLFAREVAEPGAAERNLPWLVFLQGGPGFAAPRPTGLSGWVKRAVREFRVLMLDTRGNGRSTPVLTRTLMKLPDDAARADYLKQFRADRIVDDCEFLRARLAGGARWAVLGQSYGGFCAVHYLSAHPEGLSLALVTGGLPPLDGGAEDYYQETYPVMVVKNRRWLERYPGDAALAQKLFAHLRAREVTLPTGGRLTVERFQVAGLQLGFSDGAETIHWLLEKAFIDGPDGEELSLPFLRAFENLENFQTNPIYALLHEMCYTQEAASNWAAHRVRADFPEFDWAPGKDPWLTGEMIYPWMFEQLPELRALKGTAELLARDAAWPRLYDPVRLAKNTVPCAAAVYADDPFVPRVFSEQTAAAIPGMKVWLTNEYEHDGLRQDGEKILDRLLALARG